MVNFLIAAALGCVLFLAARYVIRAKKKGRKCIGCPGNCESCSRDGYK